MVDIVYSIIGISLTYRGWQMGVGFMVLAVVLMGVIFLFRWSETRASADAQEVKQE